MIINLGTNWEDFFKDNILEYFKSLQSNPFELVTLIIDLTIEMVKDHLTEITMVDH